MSPRKLAKTVLYHARRAQIRALSAPREMRWLRRRLHLPGNQVYDPLAGDTSEGTRVTLLDAAENFRRPLPTIAGQNPGAFAFFSSRATEFTAPTYVVEFTDAIAWGHPTGGVFTADGRFVPAFTHDPSGANFHTVWTRFHLPKPKRLAGRTLYLVTPEAADNYHHWIIDLLPRLGLVRRAGYDLAKFDHVIVNHCARRYQFETLAQLGIDREKIMAASESVFVRADRLVVPSLKTSNQSLPAGDVAFLREMFPGRRNRATGRKIFLSRHDAAFRRLRHETEIHPLLRAHDFEIISPATLDVAGQARLFSEAAVIAGPAGAAFANLVFANPTARVIEIVPPQWLAVFHWMISARLGLEHTILLGDGPVMKGVPDVAARQCDILLNPEKLSVLFEEGRAATSTPA